MPTLTDSPSPQPALTAPDAVQIALTASQDLYDNLRSLGTVGIKGSSLPIREDNIDRVAALFEGPTSVNLTPPGWLIEIEFSMIGAPGALGTSYALYVINGDSGRILTNATSPVSRIGHVSR